MSGEYTAEDLDHYLVGHSSDDCYASDWWMLKDGYAPVPLKTPLGDVYLEAEYGGEGMGDDYWVVVKVVSEDPVVSGATVTRYFKKPGYYASHYGAELDGDAFEVFPKRKIITVYEGEDDA